MSFDVQVIPPKFRLLVCGDRGWLDKNLIFRTIEKYKDRIELLIQGECSGADLIAKEAAQLYDIPLPKKEYPAEWHKYGLAAGSIRNREMLGREKPHVVFAFHDNIDKSSGTADMLSAAWDAGVKCYLISHDHPDIDLASL